MSGSSRLQKSARPHSPRRRPHARPRRSFAALLCLLTQLATARALPPPDPAFFHLSTAEGLSQNNITALLQDRQGFLWIGTVHGLNRFDGAGVTVYTATPGEPNSLPHNNIRRILQDIDRDHGVLWIGTSGGLCRFEPAAGRFTTLNEDYVTDLAQAPDGTLWIGTRTGLDRLDPATKRIQHVLSTPALALLLDSSGTVWTAGPERVQRLSPDGKLTQDQAAPALVLPGALIEDHRGGVWLCGEGTDAGLGRYDQRRGRWQIFPARPGDQQSPASNACHRLALDGEGGLWLSSEQGLQRLDLSTQRFTHRYVHHQSLRGGLATSQLGPLLVDAQNGLWIGTWTSGLHRLDLGPPRFLRYRRSSQSGTDDEEGVWSLLDDRAGGIWVGATGGLYHVDRASGAWTTEAGAPRVKVYALHLARDGALWVGSSAGLYHREGPGRWRRLSHDPGDQDSLADDRVRVLREAPDGGLLVGLQRSLLDRLDPATGRFAHLQTGAEDLSGNAINSITLDRRGDLWLGGTQGLDRMDPATGAILARYRAGPGGLSHRVVHCVVQTCDGDLWIGTAGGLNRLSMGGGGAATITSWTAKSGLPDETIYGVMEDAAGWLWLTTNNGLLRFDRGSGAARRFDAEDGLLGDEFNGGAYGALADGALMAGGPFGFNVFRPQDIQDDWQPPPVVIDRVRAGGKEVPAGADFTVDHRRNSLEFSFSVLSLVQTHKNRYAYMLEGFDAGARPGSGAGLVSYTNLPPGKYVFRVRGANHDGVWNNRGAWIGFTILHPAWRTHWAYFLYVLAGTVLLWVLFQARFATIRRRTSLLEARVRERTAELQRSEQDALRAREEALRASLAKGQFLAHMSHEIRTPMNAVIGLTGLLLDTELDEVQRDFIETIRKSGDALLTIINDILDFSKIDSGRLELEEVAFSVRECVEDALDVLRPQALVKGLGLHCALGAMVPQRVRQDVTRLRQVLVNLIGNGVKFTGHGEVSVQVDAPGLAAGGGERLDGMFELRFAVTDTGIGIPPDQIGHLFQAFRQGDPSINRRFGGTGLGLAICKRLCELMGGRIWVESAPGVGTTFHFTILAAPAEAEPEVRTDRSQRGAVFQAGVVRQVLRVLVVEDHAVNQKVVCKMLERLGHRVGVAGNGREALEAVQRQTYDVVLMDVQMPEVDGLEATRRLRRLGHVDQPWVVAMTAGAMQGDREQCLAAGMNDYVSKPVRLGELEAALRRGPGRLAPWSGSGAVVAGTAKVRGRSDSAQRSGARSAAVLDREARSAAVLDREARSAAVLDREAQSAAVLDREVRSAAVLDREARSAAARRMSRALAEPAVDPGTLAQFRQLEAGGVPGVMREVLGAFAAELPGRIARLLEAVERESLRELERQAHGLKGSAGTLGAFRLASLCAELEVAGHQGDAARARRSLEALEQEAERVRALLVGEIDGQQQQPMARSEAARRP